jgi:hypothetical protein
MDSPTTFKTDRLLFTRSIDDVSSIIGACLNSSSAVLKMSVEFTIESAIGTIGFAS